MAMNNALRLGRPALSFCWKGWKMAGRDRAVCCALLNTHHRLLSQCSEAPLGVASASAVWNDLANDMSAFTPEAMSRLANEISSVNDKNAERELWDKMKATLEKHRKEHITLGDNVGLSLVKLGEILGTDMARQTLLHIISTPHHYRLFVDTASLLSFMSSLVSAGKDREVLSVFHSCQEQLCDNSIAFLLFLEAANRLDDGWIEMKKAYDFCLLNNVPLNDKAHTLVCEKAVESEGLDAALAMLDRAEKAKGIDELFLATCKAAALAKDGKLLGALETLAMIEKLPPQPMPDLARDIVMAVEESGDEALIKELANVKKILTSSGHVLPD